MQLQALKEGEPVTLEVIWGGVVYPLSSSVYKVMGDGVWIKAFYKNGQLLDFSNKAFKSAQFNFYAFIDGGKDRVVWKNVVIELKKAKEALFYQISVSVFARESVEANRRDNERVSLFLEAEITTDYGKTYPVMMRDISNSGIGFTIKKDVDLVAQSFQIKFEDEVRGTTYSITAQCKGARKVKNENDFLVGCQIEKAPKNLLYYIYYKTVDEKVGEAQTEEFSANEGKKEEPGKKSIGKGMHYI
ncbi:MAG: PilZ domain-containing protein [Lachnospiraceae bacterium]|nr:PilZ domain-containing protein [Lachnospiraceae bacterium]